MSETAPALPQELLDCESRHVYNVQTLMNRNAVRLFFCGFLILFLELVLIRYLAGSVWNMGFFPNLVLMAVFIGMGLGFLFHQHISEERSPWFFQASVFVLGLLVILLYYKHPIVPGFSRWIGNLGDEIFFTMSPHELRNLGLPDFHHHFF